MKIQQKDDEKYTKDHRFGSVLINDNVMLT